MNALAFTHCPCSGSSLRIGRERVGKGRQLRSLRSSLWLPLQAILSTWMFDGKFLLLAAQAAFSLGVCFILINLAPATAAALQLHDFQTAIFWK